MTQNEIVLAVAGFASGFGASAAVFMRVVVRKLEALIVAGARAAADLHDFQDSGVQKVEEQNMHAVLKRMAEAETKLKRLEGREGEEA
jgi:enhancing lycopene biosynthesis protein 2